MVSMKPGMLSDSKRLLLLLALILGSICLINLALAEQCFWLKLRTVVNNGDAENDLEYDHGKYLYPEYDTMGLSEFFKIKRQADVCLTQDDIASIVISRIYPMNPNAHWVNFNFTPKGAEKIEKYTRAKTDHYIALEIKGRVLAVARILSPMTSKMSLPITNTEAKAIKEYFKAVCTKITIDE